jgi:4,5-DOPA dioxygenase extradiol
MDDILRPAVPGAAYDAFVAELAPKTSERRSWREGDAPMPPIYLSHGAPPLLDDAQWIRELFGWGQTLPAPTAILAVSAHWENAPISLSTPTAQTTPVYDFGGFAPRYYTMRYDTPDAARLSAQVRAVLPDTEIVHQHLARGLDHGAWVPLSVMYPDANVPVVQLSLPSHDPDRLLELGRRLRPLREEGVLIVGSGFMTHGRQSTPPALRVAGAVPSWSSDFDAWVGAALATGAVDELASYQSKAPGMPYAHPTPEHFSPIFVTLGAASEPDAQVQPAIGGFWLGLSKGSFQVA